MGSNFPKDEIGSYITLRILKDMPNGDCVQIHLIRTNHLAMAIPPDVIQDGDKNNVDQFTDRFHFKAIKDVEVRYLKNENGEEKTISLTNLKKV